MREAQFLKQNADKWKQYERDLFNPDDPDVFADHFIELTDDLAYSRTFYPSSNTTKYLNGIAAQFHQKIYRNKKEKSSRIWSFWKFELPYLFKQYQRQFFYAFLFTVVFCFLGALSAKYDDNFIRLILGDAYVNMTNENIEKGDPFGVYRHGDQLSMFLFIAFNNIRVAFIAFVYGIFFSIGTVLLLMENGLMLGSFEYYFFAKGFGLQSVLTIFIHGTLEISAIIIAGCAGLIMGNSILFPKTFSRWDSMRKAGKDGMKIVLGLVPFFLTAAFFEGFVTRHYLHMSTGLKVSILLLSLFIIIWYFILYPIRLHKRIERAQKNAEDEKDQNFQLWLNKKLSSEK
ncbi:MAG: stage II sporulation protein M [Bacteroidetes bacterium]|nr:stage II sporulation protein M [Bacteroidota bacterium]